MAMINSSAISEDFFDQKNRPWRVKDFEGQPYEKNVVRGKTLSK